MRYFGIEFYFKYFNFFFFKRNEDNRNFLFLFVNYFGDIFKRIFLDVYIYK